MARTSVTQSDAQKWADEAIATTAALPNFAYRGDKPLGKTWAIVMTKSRDSGLLEQSNFEKAREQLAEEHEEDVDVERASHWAVGWVDHLMVRVLDRKGKATPAAKTFLEIKHALDDYPVLDEEVYSKREYEATIENIQSGRRDIDADTAAEIFTWLYDHDQSAVESKNDRGGEPDDDQIDEALRGIGRYDIVLGDLIEEIEVSWEHGDAKWRHEDRDLADDRERWGDVQIAVIEAFKASARPLPNGRVIGRALPDGSVVLENPGADGWRTIRVADERQERLPGIQGMKPGSLMENLEAVDRAAANLLYQASQSPTSSVRVDARGASQHRQHPDRNVDNESTRAARKLDEAGLAWFYSNYSLAINEAGRRVVEGKETAEDVEAVASVWGSKIAGRARSTNLSGSDRASYDEYVRTGYQDCENVYDEEVFDVATAAKELQRDVDALERSRGTMTRDARRQLVRRKAENVIRQSVTISDWQGYDGEETDLSREEAFEAWLTGWMNCALPRLTETLLEYTLGDARKNVKDSLLGGDAARSRSMTYGTLPSIEAFEKAFDAELGEDERYRIRLSRSDSKAADGTSIGDGEYTADELYRGLEELVKKFERGREAAGDLASSILSTLGFEWI